MAWSVSGWRRMLALTLGLAVAIGAMAGCSRQARHPTPGATAGEQGNGGLGQGGDGGATASPTATGGPPPPGYPGDPRTYSQSAISAWVNGQTGRLADLTSPGGAVDFANIPGHPDSHWQYYRCDGAAGSQYCTFRNGNGDELRLQLRSDLLGKPHAILDEVFEKTEYPTDPDDYVRRLWHAWLTGNRQRMLAYSTQSVVGALAATSAPENFTADSSGGGAAGSTYVRGTSTTGFSMTFRVTNEYLGRAHAVSCVAAAPAGC
jgi:hypothetical protein